MYHNLWYILFYSTRLNDIKVQIIKQFQPYFMLPKKFDKSRDNRQKYKQVNFLNLIYDFVHEVMINAVFF